MLYNFLQKNKDEILTLTEAKTLELAGSRPSSEQLKKGLPIFFEQFLTVLALGRPAVTMPAADQEAAAKAAHDSNEPSLVKASGKPEETELAISGGHHGLELMRLGYTLSHVVHAYGSMCQSVTELAEKYRLSITTAEFHDLNQCLDVAIAGAVTEFQSLRDAEEKSREVEHLGFLAHELRNALSSATISVQMIKSGTVGVNGKTANVLDKSLKRMEQIIDRSLTQVRQQMGPEVSARSGHLLQIIDQILVTAKVEALSKNQKIEIKIDPVLVIEVDEQALHSALSNLIQNAIKFTRVGGKIQVRGNIEGEFLVIEVEDECGGLLNKNATDLFQPFVQQNDNREGIGLGLTIAQRAIELNHGTIEAKNLPGKGCIFKITLPKNFESSLPRERQSKNDGHHDNLKSI